MTDECSKGTCHESARAGLQEWSGGRHKGHGQYHVRQLQQAAESNGIRDLRRDNRHPTG